jgi:plasmid maintenance system antidote protein VapI
MPGNYEGLHRYIRNRLEAMGHTPASASEVLGLAPSYVNNLLLGQFRPSQEKAIQLARFFGDDPAKILELAGYYVPPDGKDAERARSFERSLRGLDPDLQQRALEFIDFLKHLQNKRS